MHPLFKQLGMRYPIIQGAMAWVATPKLVAAVSEAGGLGVLGTGYAEAPVVQEQIQAIKRATDHAFGVNVMLQSPHAEAVMAVLVEERVPVVTTGAGNPARYLEALHAAGSLVLPVIPSVKLAVKMAQAGVDGLIAEGMESGGHIGSMTTMALVPQVVDAVDLPVIAAGGMADGRGLAAALALGAVGVQMGTRFLAAEETEIHANYKQAVVAAADTDTVITGQMVGVPARLLKSEMSATYLAGEHALAQSVGGDAGAVEDLANGSLHRAVESGDAKTGAFMAGQISGLVHDVKPVAAILEQVNSEALARLAGSPLAQLLIYGGMLSDAVKRQLEQSFVASQATREQYERVLSQLEAEARLAEGQLGEDELVRMGVGMLKRELEGNL